MKKLLLVLLCAALTGSTAAGQALQKITVDQLEQLLAANSTDSDRHRADLLSHLELTERASRARVEGWKSRYPDRKTLDALLALTDAAVLLPLPAAERPADPAPSLGEQRRIVKLAVNYLVKTLPQLPNFLAERQTVFYQEQPPETYALGPRDSSSPPLGHRPLHVVHRSTVPVAYRDGREVIDSSRPAPRNSYAPSSRLQTNGEFGSILRLLLTDAPHGNLAWDHWERGPAGLEAHFKFFTPQADSHLRVDYACGGADLSHYPAYRGEFAVDPASGAILRLTLSSTLAAPCPPLESVIDIEYGPVLLGGRTYICQTHSVSITRPPADSRVSGSQLNDVVFTNYRLFHASSRILSYGDDAPPQ